MESTTMNLNQLPECQKLKTRIWKSPYNGVLTDLHSQLAATVLQNPFWGDYRLLCSLRNIAPELTLGDVVRMKAECSLSNREDICSTLLTRLHSTCCSGLTSMQYRFLCKQIPEIRDHDLFTDSPGKLLIYQRFGGKRIKRFGRAYVHVFADMFNGHIWGQLSQQKSPQIGLAFLEKHIAPIYFEGGYPLRTIMHSAHRDSELDGLADFNIKNRCALMDISWVNTPRRSAHIERLKKALLSSRFYEHAIVSEIPHIHLQYSFAQWLKQYNNDIRA